MRELIDTEDLAAGDVLMIKKPFEVENPSGPSRVVPWRFFGIVREVGSRGNWVTVHRISNNPDLSEYYVYLADPGVTAWLLEPDEWPDGVLVIRTKLILLGEIEV